MLAPPAVVFCSSRNEPNLEMANSSACAMWLGAAEIDRFEELRFLIGVGIDHRHRGRCISNQSLMRRKSGIETLANSRTTCGFCERPGYMPNFFQRECMFLSPWDISVAYVTLLNDQLGVQLYQPGSMLPARRAIGVCERRK